MRISFAKRLSPELYKPLGKLLKCIRVGEEHIATLSIGVKVLIECLLEQMFLTPRKEAFGKERCTIKKCIDIISGNTERYYADSTQDRKSSSHVIGDSKLLQSVKCCKLGENRTMICNDNDPFSVCTVKVYATSCDGCLED